MVWVRVRVWVWVWVWVWVRVRVGFSCISTVTLMRRVSAPTRTRAPPPPLLQTVRASPVMLRGISRDGRAQAQGMPSKRSFSVRSRTSEPTDTVRYTRWIWDTGCG